MIYGNGGICRKLLKDEGGNVFLLFGAVSIAVILILGGAVDFARHARYKAELTNVVDAAALALARVGEDFTEEQAETYVSNYVSAFEVADSDFDITEFDVTKTDEGFRVVASADMDAAFLPLGQINSTYVNVESEVVLASNRLELALVLDNTGSMNCVDAITLTCAMDWSSPDSGSRIVALRSAAKTLVDHAPNSADLEDIFERIGEDLSRIHLSM